MMVPYNSTGICAFGDIRGEKGIKELLIQADPSVSLEDIAVGLNHVQLLETLQVTGSSMRPQCMQRLYQWQGLQHITCFGICPGLDSLQGKDMMKLVDCHSLESLSIDRSSALPWHQSDILWTSIDFFHPCNCMALVKHNSCINTVVCG